MNVSEIMTLAMTLDEGDRADLAAMILDSLDGADPNDSDEDSLTEAKRRAEELWSGAVKGISGDEFMAEFRALRENEADISSERRRRNISSEKLEPPSHRGLQA